MFLKLLIINLAIILVIDLSGFVTNIKHKLSRLLTKDKISTTEFRMRPFDCSFCMTFWCLLAYVVYTQQFTFITVFYIVVITHFTDVTKQVLLLLKDIAVKIINTIYDRLQIK